MDVVYKQATIKNKALPLLFRKDSGLDGLCCCALSGIVDFNNNRLLIWAAIIKSSYETNDSPRVREEEIVAIEVSLDKFKDSPQKPDFYDFKIIDSGCTVAFGNYEVSTETVCYLAGVEKPVEFIDNLNIRYAKELIDLGDHRSSAENNSLARLMERYNDRLQGYHPTS